MHVNSALWALLQFLSSLQVPSQVTGVSLSKAVRGGRPALRVSWTAPQSNVVSEYHVQSRRSGIVTWDVQVTATPDTYAYVSSLEAGTEYDVRVRARSDRNDEGEWSEVQTERTFRSEFECIIRCYQLHVHLYVLYQCYRAVYVGMVVVDHNGLWA